MSRVSAEKREDWARRYREAVEPHLSGEKVEAVGEFSRPAPIQFALADRPVATPSKSVAPPGSTGLRAAALKKCKKKAKKKGWTRKQLQKCKKKAKLLPI